MRQTNWYALEAVDIVSGKHEGWVSTFLEGNDGPVVTEPYLFQTKQDAKSAEEKFFFACRSWGLRYGTKICIVLIQG